MSTLIIRNYPRPINLRLSVLPTEVAVRTYYYKAALGRQPGALARSITPKAIHVDHASCFAKVKVRDSEVPLPRSVRGQQRGQVKASIEVEKGMKQS